MKDLSVRLKTIKVSEENIRENLYDIGLNVFLDMTPKAQATKAKIDMGLPQGLKLWCIKGHNQQSKKRT